MQIKFSDLPGQLNLFLDFLYEYENVKEFYPLNVRNLDSLDSKFNGIINNYAIDREILRDIITEQYKITDSSAVTKSNIKLLSEANTVTVTTGQQLGIFTGPLYTIYKAVTTIKLAEYLKLKYDEFNFVPVFWMAGNDHDFDEVKYINLIDLNNKVKKIEYNDGLEPDTNRGEVGNLIFTDDIYRVVSEIADNLRKTEYTDKVIDFISMHYKPGESFSSSFRNMMFHFFDEYGLILLDPTDQRIKEVLKPVFLKEISDYKDHTDTLVSLSAELEETYHAQVKVKPINLFMHYEKGRYLIEPIENKYRLKGKRKKFTADELLEQITNSPELFSPNVLLRPVCQDYLLPNSFYVGGPSEICYYAQLKPLYEFFGMTPPMVYPRSSATLLESNPLKILAKFQMKLKELIINSKDISAKIINKLDSGSADTAFLNAFENIEKVFDELENSVSEVDPTLIEAVRKTKAKSKQQIDALKSKVEKAQLRRYEDSLRQIERAMNLIYPNNNLQERELNIIYFLNKYGMDFVKRIYSQLSINKFAHQIIEI